MRNIAIVGASLAGLHAAQALRRAEFDGPLALIGDEVHYPYDRPPLSKEFLAGSMDEDRLRLRPAADPAALGVDWHLGCSAVGLELSADLSSDDRSSHVVRLDDGTAVEADGVIIATGARARTLPGADGVGGVHVLRNLDDARQLRAEIGAAVESGGGSLLVVGCGFIGAEVAATARGRGLDVTIVETAPAPLTRVLDEAAGMAVAELHRSHGVDVRLGIGVATLNTTHDRVTSVELTDGSVVDATIVVIGIGVVPNVDWLAGSGLEIDDGVVTDGTCLAAPGIVAVGDVARWPNPRFGGEARRVEQWDNAVEMGGYGAKRLLAWADDAAYEAYAPVPWFWSDQYDRKIQLAGVPGPGVELVQGTLEEQRFVQLYLDEDGAVSGTLCWNRPRQAIMSRQLIAAGAPLSEVREALS